MKNPSTSAPNELKTLEERLAAHPDLKIKIESLLTLVEQSAHEVKRADEVEQQVIEEIRMLGQTALQDWATQANQTAREQFIQTHPQAHRSRKKTLLVQPIRSNRGN